MLIVSEQAFIDNLEIAIKNLKNLQQLSIKISINDFKTRYFALIKQHNLFIDDLKLNASLIKEAIPSQTEGDFYSAIIATAHNLGMTVTVDGIDDIEQFNSLKELNCKFGQGVWVSQNFSSKLGRVTN